MIIHSPIFSGSINQAESAYANLSGSFTGSFKGIGQFEGLEADSVAFDNVTGKPTLVSGSSQVSYPDLSNIPSGIVSSSAQLSEIFLDTLGDGVVSGSSQISYPGLSNIPSGIVSGSSQVTPLLPSGVVSGSSQVSYPDLSNIPAGITSGSSQVVSLLDSQNVNLGGISGSSLDITGNTKLDGNIVLGNASNDSISFVGELNSDIILATDNANDLGSPTHRFAEVHGVNIYGAINATNGVVSGSSQITYSGISAIPAGIVSGSSQVTPLLPSGVVSGSSQVNADSITNFDSNVKDKLNADLVISGSASDVKTFLSLQNVTNESKATMFTSPALTGTPTAPTAPANTNSTQIATTAYVQQELTDLIGGANEAFDTLLEISASLASGDSTLNTLVDGKLSKSANLSDLTNTSTARTNLGVAIGTDVQAYNIILESVASGSYAGDDSISILGTITTGNVTQILPTGVVSGSGQINVASTTGDIVLGSRTSGNYVATITAGNGIVSSGATSGEGIAHTLSVGGGVVSGSSQITYASISSIPAGIVSGSAQVTPLLPTGVVSGSAQITAGSTTGFATAVKTQLDANTVVSGSSQINVASTTGDIALGTRTSGNYVASLVQGTGVTITNNSGEGATPTIAIGQAVATTSEVQFAKVGVGGASDATYELRVVGDIGATGDIVAYVSSDERLKNNVELISNPIEKVQALRGVTWEWNELASDAAKQSPNVGVIAQEVEKVLPQLVHDRENGFKGVDYAKLTGLLIEAIKEQQKQIDELKSRL